MLDRQHRAEFESYRKALVSDDAKCAFDDKIERLLSKHGVDYVRGYVDALKESLVTITTKVAPCTTLRGDIE